MAQPLAANASALLADCLNCWGGKYDGTGDVLFYGGNGFWSTGQAEPLEWSYNHSPGLAGATQYRWGQYPRTHRNLERAVRTINRCIADFQFPDGGWQDYSTTTRQSAEIATYFWGVELATAYIALQPYIGRQYGWDQCLKASCDFLIGRQVTGGRYYSNGNIQLGYVELLELTAIATGDLSYATAATTALDWAMNPVTNPSNPLINGGAYGWVEEVVPAQADGSDGKGYFRESTGATTPGLDWRYLHLQSSVASRLYMATGKIAYLRMTNMMLNKLMEHVTTPAWTIDLTGGSRITSGTDPFLSPAPFVAAWVGGTASWTSGLSALMDAVNASFRVTLNSRTANFLRDSAKMLAPIVRAGA